MWLEARLLLKFKQAEVSFLAGKAGMHAFYPAGPSQERTLSYV